MATINENEARRMWREALHQRGWLKRTIAAVMFDWDCSFRKTNYHPAPAWPTIVDSHGQADLDEYRGLQDSILAQGDRYSDAGRRSGRHSSPPVPYSPLPIDESLVLTTMAQVMSTAHPRALRQEQVFRAAFVSRLPSNIAIAIGTMSSTVHPERPTPSNTYSLSGKRQMRARFDIGFGHPDLSDGIRGVIELKVVGSFDSNFDKLSSNDPTVDPVSGKADRDPLFVDFQKLLDPNLPAGSFRISWIAAGRRGHLDPKRIAEKAAGVIERIEAERGISKRKTEVDLQTGWLKWNWSDGVCLKLAWYQPSGGEATRFQPVWAS